jgi:hypothetical protein
MSNPNIVPFDDRALEWQAVDASTWRATRQGRTYTITENADGHFAVDKDGADLGGPYTSLRVAQMRALQAEAQASGGI